MYKEERNMKRSSFLIKTVILMTYETPLQGPWNSTILTVMDPGRALFSPGKAGVNKERFIPFPDPGAGVEASRS